MSIARMPPKKDSPLRRTALVSLVAHHGRVLERSCFRGRAGSERAQEHAFQHLELAGQAPEDESHEMEYEEVPDFPEICAELLSVDAWHLVDYGHFVLDEDTMLLETRSALRAVQSACEEIEMCALVLLLTKGRTRSFPVLAVIRRISIRNSTPCQMLFGFSMGAV